MGINFKNRRNILALYEKLIRKSHLKKLLLIYFALV